MEARRARPVVTVVVLCPFSVRPSRRRSRPSVSVLSSPSSSSVRPLSVRRVVGPVAVVRPLALCPRRELVLTLRRVA